MEQYIFLIASALQNGESLIHPVFLQKLIISFAIIGMLLVLKKTRITPEISSK